jgi:hypothetical protein
MSYPLQHTHVITDCPGTSNSAEPLGLVYQRCSELCPAGAVLGIHDILMPIWICTSDEWIQLRIRLLSLVTLRMQKKKLFLFFSYNLPAGTVSSVL